MKKHRVIYLFILVFCNLAVTSSFRFHRESDAPIFEFTAPVYNLSVEENSVGSKYARSDNATKIGVPMPEKDATCKFRVAEVVGEKSSLFKAHARQVGDFVFLRVRYKGDNPLNRELKEHYDMLVKATCKRRDSSNLETTARVHLTVIDRNDASPMFLVDDAYEATIEDTTEPFSKVLQVEASDADIGINSAIYYSMVNRSHLFFVDPVTGWIRTLKQLKAGKYELKLKSEDRASRLFYFDENEVQPSWTADVIITVTETKRKQTKIHVETRKIDGQLEKRQLAAIVTLKDAPKDVLVGLEYTDVAQWFELVKSQDGWDLFAKNGRMIPMGTNVTIHVGYDYVPLNSKRIDNSTATIAIEHLAEHSIQFESSKFSFIVNEMVPVGTEIGRIEAITRNPDDRGLMRYSIKSATKNQSFSIGAKSGVIRVAGNLNYELERVHEFEIIAKLYGMEKSATISGSIEITDGNDHAPVWAAKWLRQAPLAVGESTKIGDVLLKVDAHDRDASDNGRIGYKIASDEATPFRVDVETGEISLGAPLPKNENQWNLAIWAIDWGTPLPRSSALNLVFYRNGTKIPAKPKPTIVQEASNEHSPMFKSFPQIVEVVEDASIGTIIARVHAIDEDNGYNGLVRYLIASQEDDVDGILGVNSTSGEVFVASSLGKVMKAGKTHVDFEMNLIAEDSGAPPKRVVKALKLRVIDVNNNSPKFDQPWYRIHVSEDTATGKELLKIVANDDDGGENARIRYSISNFQNDEDLEVSIDKNTGIIKLRKMLDRELRDELGFTVIAADSGSPPRMSFANLTIIVDDVNDNPPRCTQLVTKARIPEDYPHGAFVTCVSASDPDVGQNARIRYTMESQKVPFRVDHHTGCVFVHAPDEPMDFHKTPWFNLTIDAADNGEQVLSTNCQLRVELIDVVHNHLPIEFDEIAKEASVYENSPSGTEVIMVEAKEVTDERRRMDNVRYSIIDGDGRAYFTIDDKGMVRTSTPLDREHKSAHWLTIEARDPAIDNGLMSAASSARRRAIIHVYVRVLDRNDHRPQPRQPVYFGSVKENSAANVVIVKVEANDADDAGNDVAPPLQFKIERGDPQSFFRIDSTSGYVTTSGSRRLDREKQAEHELWISVCDGGEPQLCSQVVVVVAVEDENDNAPTFTQPIHHYNVRANFVGELCRVFAIDIDSGDNSRLFYNITEGDDRFSIDENGVISTTQAIHGDESYAMTVQATDRGEPAQHSAARVVLTAIGGKKTQKGKNNAPAITGKKSDYVIPISDADQVGLTIGKMEATDEDGDELWWSITASEYTHNFDIRKDNGQLLLARKVDTLPKNVREIRMSVSVTDGVDSDTSVVIIQVSRSATQRPKFTATHYQTDVSERTPVGSQIYTLKANGEDLGPGTKPLVFSIFSVEDIGMEEKIRIEPSSGNVIVMESLDFEASRQIRATVQVRQAGLKNFATLVVNIDDENDNAPRFETNEKVAFVDESDAIGAVVTRVTAFDADIGENGLVSYSIVSGNERDLFELDKIKGEIRLKKMIDRETHVESILRIRATDSGKPPLSDELNVHVRNSNTSSDTQVKFVKKGGQVIVRESTPPGTPLTALNVHHHGSVAFRAAQPCPYFDVHLLSGAVHLAKWLTRERKAKSVNCTMIAEANDGAKDEMVLVAKILRTNEHSPIFRSQVYRGQIRENSPIGTPVLINDNSPLIVSATDADNGPNALIAYKIVGDDGQFVVDLISGAIRVRSSLDYEKVKEIQFYVQAFDMGHPPRSSQLPALVIVKVVDENDEAPMFDRSELTSKPILLPSANGILVARQTATDRDTVGRVRYFIKDAQANRLFSVNSTTGAVTVRDAMKLKDGEHTFDVFASDGIRSTSYKLKVPLKSVTNKDGFRFVYADYRANVTENSTYPTGKHLLTVATMGTKFGVPIVYSIVNEHTAFLIHPGTGVIALTGEVVDREEQATIRLIVQAKALDGEQESIAQSCVDINVDDVNDNAPRFVNVPYDAAASVDTPIGQAIISIKAIDDDDGLNGRVQYSAKNLPDVFKLSKTNGSITVAKALDKPTDYEFEVIVEDSGNPKLKATEKVKIRVVDKCQPVFSQKTYEVMVSPRIKKGDVVLKVKAKSNAPNGMIGYKWEKKMNESLFDVDFVSGEVRLTRDPRMIRGESMSLVVEAVETTRPKLISTAEVVIKTKPKKKEAPVFEKKLYSTHVAESAAVGEELVSVSASGDDVSYAIQGDDEGVFSIDVDVIRLAKPLDFQKRQRYDVSVVASNQRQIQSSVPLQLFVDDVNDEAPTFISPFVGAEIDDAAVPGQFVTILSVTDMDTVASLPDDQKLLYKIVDGDETLFDIDSTNGQVSLARMIEDEDLMESSKKLLNVSVTDGIFTSYAKLSVDVRKSGRRTLPPQFEQSQYIASASENTAANKSALITVAARDGIAPIRYSLGPADSSAWPVRIDKNSGRVHATRVLNYHLDRVYQIPLVAEDAVGRRAFATLTLNVIDINDKPPVFVLSSYACSMPESAKDGDTVLMVSATDDDTHESIEYSLLDEDQTLFAVHPKQGTVTVAKKLERKAGKTYTLNVKATDSANPPHHATTVVEINVASDGTPVPRFSNSHYLFAVSEDEAIGNVIGKVQQVDNDVGEVRFSISQAPEDLPFSVERSTGKIIVRAALDRERRAQWRMAVRADAAGGVHAVTTVTIDVIDVNDNAPAFQGDYERLTISEDAPVGTSVAIFSATDRDESPSGKIRFTIVEDVKSFEMNEDTGWLTVRQSLDRERQEVYKMTARATDEGGLNTDLKFSVVVMDVNDSPPVFDQTNYVAELSADQLPTDGFLKIAINDADLAPNNSSQLFISSGNEEGIFGINEKMEIYIRRMGMVAQKSRYEMKLTAFDGVFASTGNAIVDVKQMEEFECPDKEKKLEVRENAKKGTLVVDASELSIISELIYAIRMEDGAANPFVINYRNGVIKVKDNIDYESTDVLMVIRQTLSKKKKVVCEERIQVEVLDENDNAPKMEKSEYRVTIKENLPANEEERQLITIVKATDADTNDRLFYELDEPQSEFKIDDNGVLTCVKPLDRESKAEYRLTVSVKDEAGHEAKAIVIVDVADQNDNPPVFEKKSYHMKVMESESTGYELAKIRAIGGDDGETVSYRLEKANEYVKLEDNGRLSLVKNLDYETVKRIDLVVIATDSGIPPLKTNANIEILVMDENDNAPQFEKTKYEGSVNENAKPGTKVLAVKAVDKDSEHFGRVTYSIVPIVSETLNQRIPFIIDEDGWIRVNASIDYETDKVFEFDVKASDGGMPALSSKVRVAVNVNDLNDNAPMFDDCNMTAVVQEGAEVGHVVARLMVKDADGPKNSGPFKFHLKGDGAAAFKVVDASVLTNGRLSHAKMEKFELTVVAKDVKGKASECPLTVWIKEESRHAPELKPLMIRVNTLKDELTAGDIGRLVAFDADKEDILRFAMVEDSVVGPLPTLETPRPVGKAHTFRVDALTGMIWAEHSIPAGMHAFNVTVTDGTFNAVSYVQIEVSSVDNDVIEHAVAIRIRSMTVKEFFESYEAIFRRVISAHLNVQSDQIQLISVQEVGEKRMRRSVKDLEVLMTAQRGHGRGFLKPDHIYSRLKLDFQNIEEQSEGMRYQLITEMCTTGVCHRGECRERIELLEDNWTRAIGNETAFVSPQHTRSAQCLCPDGFGGERCEQAINECSRSPCRPWQMCIASSSGFECACPLGMHGERCERPSCSNDGRCLEEAEVSVGGDGYIEMSLSNEVETRMEIEIEMKTTSQTGVVMWAAANSDFHELSIVNGFIEYNWEAGSGLGNVRSKTTIADGKWHRISISRRQRRTRLTVDDNDVQEGFSPIGSTVINLHRFSQKIIFGAKAEPQSDGTIRISDGVSACFRTISVDGRKVPKTRQGLKLFAASPGCSALTSSPCSEMPCSNGGSCMANGRAFTCVCPMRYSGERCEIDTEPCSSQPCPKGIQCIPFYNDYLCKCPNGFTGKHCESRGFTEVESSCSTEDRCGKGQCISIPRQNPQSADFICNCTGGILQSTPCQDDNGYSLLGLIWRIEVAIIVASVLLILVIIAVVFICCRCCRRPRDPKYGAHCDVPHMRNTRVLMPAVDPPPLPPRGYRTGDPNTFMNTSNANRPTVQVRPFSNGTHQRHESRSPSVCGSSKGSRRNLEFEKRRQKSEDMLSDGGGSGLNRVRQSDRRNERGFNDALTSLRDGPLMSDDWRTSLDENISAAVRSAAEGKIVVGNTELAPVVNDDDYMTMKPRKDKIFEKETVKEEDESEQPPAVPPHGVGKMEQSVLYDDPNAKVYDDPSKACSIDDIDGSDVEEVRIHLT